MRCAAEHRYSGRHICVLKFKSARHAYSKYAELAKLILDALCCYAGTTSSRSPEDEYKSCSFNHTGVDGTAIQSQY
ncbi:MAG: hypothetical protein II948_08650 [Synergistaceae bacterium]|nr:hypothetical protein [Synergistaceae bacterium]MBQ4418555.1 hypothetical protein [Synergistaceae bacterium]MBQ7570172.1 hypothetical protein [Synergistaceae bacterium]MBQ9582036.1 hypothetical protein [Synergistaceae bacterium]MBQ9897572.1 hypothetical protein [Synergistaceae bacterium]